MLGASVWFRNVSCFTELDGFGLPEFLVIGGFLGLVHSFYEVLLFVAVVTTDFTPLYSNTHCSLEGITPLYVCWLSSKSTINYCPTRWMFSF